MNITIRRATEDDIDALYDISCSVHLSDLYRTLIPQSQYERFAKHYTPSPQQLALFYEKYVTRLYDSSWYIWVAEDDGEVVGFTVAYKTDETLALKGLFVLGAYQGRGIGRALFETSCSIAEASQPIALEVLRENTYAIRLYEKQGFKKSAVVDDYYGGVMVQMTKH